MEAEKIFNQLHALVKEATRRKPKKLALHARFCHQQQPSAANLVRQAHAEEAMVQSQQQVRQGGHGGGVATAAAGAVADGAAAAGGAAGCRTLRQYTQEKPIRRRIARPNSRSHLPHADRRHLLRAGACQRQLLSKPAHATSHALAPRALWQRHGAPALEGCGVLLELLG
uniref:Uncharacterized protein n=1 Tax=Tetradesmus obliquus TaxID=3088 RepID=A0A383VY26_TETOB|eukprot:jgi/Sobl393_1/16798/SZX69769.1